MGSVVEEHNKREDDEVVLLPAGVVLFTLNLPYRSKVLLTRAAAANTHTHTHTQSKEQSKEQSKATF